MTPPRGQGLGQSLKAGGLVDNLFEPDHVQVEQGGINADGVPLDEERIEAVEAVADGVQGVTQAAAGLPLISLPPQQRGQGQLVEQRFRLERGQPPRLPGQAAQQVNRQ